MRIYDFGENADEGKWTLRGENLTWGNSEVKLGENGWSPVWELLQDLVSVSFLIIQKLVSYYNESWRKIMNEIAEINNINEANDTK